MVTASKPDFEDESVLAELRNGNRHDARATRLKTARPMPSNADGLWFALCQVAKDDADRFNEALCDEHDVIEEVLKLPGLTLASQMHEMVLQHYAYALGEELEMTYEDSTEFASLVLEVVRRRATLPVKFDAERFEYAARTGRVYRGDRADMR